MENAYIRINILDYDPKDRYPTVSRTFESLKTGEKMELINDHDVRPLLQYKLTLDFPEQYDWEFIEQGPEIWRAVVTKR